MAGRGGRRRSVCPNPSCRTRQVGPVPAGGGGACPLVTGTHLSLSPGGWPPGVTPPACPGCRATCHLPRSPWLQFQSVLLLPDPFDLCASVRSDHPLPVLSVLPRPVGLTVPLDSRGFLLPPPSSAVLTKDDSAAVTPDPVPTADHQAWGCLLQ